MWWTEKLDVFSRTYFEIFAKFVYIGQRKAVLKLARCVEPKESSHPRTTFSIVGL